MKKSSYNPYFFNNSGPFDIVGIYTDDTLILVDNSFARKEKAVIQIGKIRPKNRKRFTSSHPLKFHKAQIKLDLERIVLIKESHIGNILPITNHDVDSPVQAKLQGKSYYSKYSTWHRM